MSASEDLITSIRNEVIASLRPELERMVRAEFKDTLHSYHMDAEEAALYIGVHKDTVMDMARTNELPSFKVRRRTKFRKASVDRWILDQEAKESDYEYRVR